MKGILPLAVGLCLGGVASSVCAPGPEPTSLPPLQLESKIPLGAVRGRIDHFAVDLARQRVFLAELGNDSVSAIDLKDGKVVHRLSGLKEPQGVGFVPATDTLYVASGGDGSVRLFGGESFAEAGRIDLGDDADNIRADGTGQQVLVGYGNGGVAVIDAVKKQKVGNIALKAHPESFQVSASTGRIFVNVPKTREIAVIDRAAGRQIASWPMSAGGNFPMALNEAGQQVLVAFRDPARLGVFGLMDGKSVATLELCGDADDVFVDAKRLRVYASCGAGFVDVFDADGPSYRRSAHIPTIEGARTALFIPELDRLLVAARATGSAPAAVWVFRVGP
jgi:DNA-binding beta-propeller fold protein YncE